MFGTLGGPEIFLILVIALIVFGPRKLPEIGRSVGNMMNEFRRASNEFRRTVEDEVEADRQRALPVASASEPLPGTIASGSADPAPPALAAESSGDASPAVASEASTGGEIPSSSDAGVNPSPVAGGSVANAAPPPRTPSGDR